ncbi:MAG: hypothetical protein ORO03_03680 [Alphaproteobacteria bacterium]|nr:hypothetical protein [Alphaproteobacteria bacterium]
MSSSIKAIFDQAIQPNSPYLKVLQDRGLVRRDLTVDDLKSEPVRGDAVEQALILFAAETQRAERQDILAELQARELETSVQIAAFKTFEKPTTPDAVFRKMEGKADDIWRRSIAPVRERSREASELVAGASEALAMRDYDKASDLIEQADVRMQGIETEFREVYSVARRELRRDYNAEFGSRVWNAEATKHFDTLVNRTTFVPPEEMRNAAHEVSETKQRLISEKSYVTELEKRAQARPSAKPSASFKP